MHYIKYDCLVHDSKLKKLSEDSLTKQPEEVFDVLEKLGEGCVPLLYLSDIEYILYEIFT